MPQCRLPLYLLPLFLAGACTDSMISGVDATPPSAGPLLSAPLLAASATDPNSFKLVSGTPGALCAEVGSDSRVSVRDCTGSPSQLYVLESNGDLKQGDKCIAVLGWGNDGDLLGTAACNNTLYQKWSVASAGTIRGINGKCIDIVDGKGLAGSPLKLASCNGAYASQKWTMSKGELSVPTVPPVAGQDTLIAGTAVSLPLVSKTPAALCTAIGGDNRLTLQACNATAAQTFAWQANGEMRNGTNCVTVLGWGNDGDLLGVAACNGTLYQKWSATAVGEVRGMNNKCVDVVGRAANVGNALTLSGCNNAATQRWRNVSGSVSTPVPTPVTPVPVPTPGPTTTPGSIHSFFVSPTAASGGNGAVDRPWTLPVALAHPSTLVAGDTIWLRGGVYRGNMNSVLRGTVDRPIIVRQYPGERAIVDGGLAVAGAYTWYWGFEIMNSNVGALVTGVDVTAPGSKFINLTVHDAAGNGFGVWSGAVNAELYGNILYNNGRAGSTAARYAHGIYFQNTTGTLRLVDNVVLNSYSYNFHGYTEGAALNNMYLEGNVSFNAGSFVNYGGAEYLVGGGQPVRNLNFTGNFSYRGGGTDARNEFGYEAATPVGNRVTNNYFTGVTKLRFLDGLVFTGNTLANASREMIEIFQNPNQSLGSGFTFSNNTYFAPNSNNVAAFRRVVSTGTGYSWADWRGLLGYDGNSTLQVAAASETRVVVRPNLYEKGRANVVVYNWSKQGSVSVDLSAVLTAGDRFEVRNVQDIFGTPVLTGTFAGGSVALPMSAIVPVRPIGPISYEAPSTGSEFQTFVVMKKL